MLKAIYEWLKSRLSGSGTYRVVDVGFVRKIKPYGNDKAIALAKRNYKTTVSPARFWADLGLVRDLDRHALIVGMFYLLLEGKYGKDLRNNQGGRLGEFARFCVKQILPTLYQSEGDNWVKRLIGEAMVDLDSEAVEKLSHAQLPNYHADSVSTLADCFNYQRKFGAEKLWDCAISACNSIERETVGAERYADLKDEHWAGEHHRAYWQAKQEQIEWCKLVLIEEGLWY